MQQISRFVPNTTAATLLKIGGLNLLLPQVDIRTLESATDVDRVAPALHSAGWISYIQKRWPVYCLSEDMALMNVVPHERRACALMTMGAGYIGIMCDDMIVLKNFSTQRYDLPVAMKFTNTPILHLVTFEQDLACVSNARCLTAYVGQLVLNE